MRSNVIISLLGLSASLVLTGCLGIEGGDDLDEETLAAEEIAADDEETAEAEADLVAWCDDTVVWSAAWGTLENNVITLLNQKRATGAVCGGVVRPPVPALTKDDRLRCAARKHVKDMAQKNFFSRTGSDNSTFVQRIDESGYTWTTAAENIGAGHATAAAAVNAWMMSPEHCDNIMNPRFKHLGVGYFNDVAATYDHYWTISFGQP